MVQHFIEEFKRKFNEDISEDKGLKRTLKTHCEQAKRILSTAAKADFQLQGTHLMGSLTRVRFEDLCLDLFEKSIELVEEALNDANMAKEDINDIVLVGGSSRIPKVQELLKEFFDGKELNKTVNPDEAVANGAAIQAAMIQNQLNDRNKGITLADVCPLSLGTAVLDGSVLQVIKRNTPIPIEKSEILQTVYDNQIMALIDIYEGERVMAIDNHLLGSFVIDEIPPGPRGSNIENLYQIDADGILTVSAVVPQTGHKRELKIINESRLSREDAELVAEEAAQLRADDEMHRNRLAVWNDFESYVYKVKRKGEQLPSPVKEVILKEVNELTEWLHANTMASIEEIQRHHQGLRVVWENIDIE